MHRIDGLDHVANMFDPGDPMVPREATQVTDNWLNSVQEEIANVIEGAGIALVSSGALDSARNQLLAAIDSLNPVKAACVVSCDGSGGVTVVGTARNVSAPLTGIEAAAGGTPSYLERIRVSFTVPLLNPICATVTVVKQPSVGTLPESVIVPIVQRLTNDFVEFAISTSTDGGGDSSHYTPTIGSLSQRYAVTVIGA